jgi:hypothetical protein
VAVAAIAFVFEADAILSNPAVSLAYSSAA